MGSVAMMLFFSQTTEMHGLLAHMSTICTCRGLKLRENATLLFGWLGRLGVRTIKLSQCFWTFSLRFGFGRPPRDIRISQSSTVPKPTTFLSPVLRVSQATIVFATAFGLLRLATTTRRAIEAALPRPLLSYAAVRLWRNHQAGY